MSLEKVMTKRVVTIGADASLAEVQRIFAAKLFHHLLVVENDQLVGMVSDRDLLKALSPNLGTASETRRDTATLNKKVHQIMTRQLWVLTQDDDIFDAISLMNQQKISCLPVIDQHRKPIGILSWRDILRLLSEGKAKRDRRFDAYHQPLQHRDDII